MGLFDKIFKNQQDIAKEDIKEVPWHPLTTQEQLDELLEESDKHAVAVFKHSTRCGISKMVLKRFENAVGPDYDERVKLYFLDLLSNREISNQIADRLDVQHESPQLLIIKNKKVVHHASHDSISAESLGDYQ